MYVVSMCVHTSCGCECVCLCEYVNVEPVCVHVGACVYACVSIYGLHHVGVKVFVNV